MKPLVPIYLVLMLATNAFADSWISPTPRTVASPKGEFLLRTIPPRRLEKEKDEFTKMKLIVYRLNPSTQDYKETTRFDVDENPVEVFINDTGDRIVTMNKFWGVGNGPRVVVVYNSSGRKLKSWALEDFYDKKKIKLLPEITSSVFWRGPAHWSGDDTILIDKVSDFGRNENSFDDYRLDVRTLKITKWKFLGFKGIPQEK